MSIGLSIIYSLVGLFILYIVIETAVRKGINSSLVGRYLEEKKGIKEEKKPLSKDDFESDV